MSLLLWYASVDGCLRQNALAVYICFYSQRSFILSLHEIDYKTSTVPSSDCFLAYLNFVLVYFLK